MAPEVINHQNHSFQADFFAVGVIAYECMLGKVLFFLIHRGHIVDIVDNKLGNK